MRLCLDENMPLQLRFVLGDHEVSSVERQGWKGTLNGDLLNLLQGRFDVFLTSDGSIRHQQNIVGQGISFVVVPTNNLTLLRANAIAIRITLDEFANCDQNAIVTIDWKGRRTVRGLAHENEETRQLTPVPPFS